MFEKFIRVPELNIIFTKSYEPVIHYGLKVAMKVNAFSSHHVYIFRSEKHVAIAVASSIIAATLLEGGRTAHSAFKLSLNLSHYHSSLCNIFN